MHSIILTYTYANPGIHSTFCYCRARLRYFAVVSVAINFLYILIILKFFIYMLGLRNN